MFVLEIEGVIFVVYIVLKVLTIFDVRFFGDQPPPTRRAKSLVDDIFLHITHFSSPTSNPPTL